MQLGIYSFGDLAPSSRGGFVTSAEATRNLVEAITLADEVGLDYFGIGEHHIMEAPASAAATILAGAATRTKRIRLASSVTVLGTDDPVRVFQQFATVDALSGGRAEITAGRGSSPESFPLFGYSVTDHDTLFREKLGLLMQLNEQPEITWQGTTRSALKNATVVPRPEQDGLPIWLGTGGNPASTVRAARLGLPVAYGITGGHPARFAPLTDLYRETFAQNQSPFASPAIAVGVLGFVGDDDATARNTWFLNWHQAMRIAGEQRGFPAPGRRHFDADAVSPGGIMAGSPQDVADRVIALHEALGHDRHILQMDIGHLPHHEFLHAIELLGTKVKPLVDAALGTVPERVPALGSPRMVVPA